MMSIILYKGKFPSLQMWAFSWRGLSIEHAMIFKLKQVWQFTCFGMVTHKENEPMSWFSAGYRKAFSNGNPCLHVSCKFAEHIDYSLRQIYVAQLDQLYYKPTKSEYHFILYYFIHPLYYRKTCLLEIDSVHGSSKINPYIDRDMYIYKIGLVGGLRSSDSRRSSFTPSSNSLDPAESIVLICARFKWLSFNKPRIHYQIHGYF